MAKAERPRADGNASQLGAGGGGSNDVDSGGGAGSGVPDAETAERVGEAINRGDVATDRQRIVGDVAELPSHGKRKTNPDVHTEDQP